MPLIRPPRPEDRPAWERLYAGYAAFYRVDQTPEMRARVWGWVIDPAHEVEARLAVAPDGALLGLAHFRPFARPLSASTGGFLDDLFVAPEARGQGVARALIEALRAETAARGWSVLRWITADDNVPARVLYDSLAQATRWLTYDARP
ncbi:GNAT family N-acetyltransferase [Rhodobacter veldkampii DSM 11550]|uniref:GNAT family N-acetyltransferase n=1 Tax=Phaeovulum veldkampii DSM 11550 TaxID=1185920 RepID=A0A2T4JIY0_9RHOB|nr:GNAT family N-acetyltransferase [Phaeovulum veldkampii]MBK5946811.1 GNAT family N-acetyltransferase [Phaeovulum veldkampii DSM 11550]NCU20270.1 GNAT family N-acetyltransferase [Candidatus Falkowbacteria bacterium]PTE17832.1 GNAT family N-acetyltransferase [Phaeovulum veldkampii DSM 11550]TDQ63383.1 L-amino acid N-acyltransferase YncA [Phaeovulum veldkampii DSM 11550]